MRKLSSAACGLFVVLTLFLSPVSRAENLFQVGADAQDIKLPQGISLAGYFQRNVWLSGRSERQPFAHVFKSSTGVRDTIRAKATVLKIKDKKMVFLNLDLIAVFPEIREALSTRLKDLGIQKSDLFVTATHTHSGPGGYVRFKFWEFLAMDLFVDPFYQELLKASETAIRAANTNLEPAQIQIRTQTLSGVSKNRRDQSFIDQTLTVFRFESIKNKKAIVNWLNFPIHSDLLQYTNLELSADVAGSFERSWEKEFGEKAFFYSGAAGNIDPDGVTMDSAGVEQIGKNFIQSVRMGNQNSVVDVLEPKLNNSSILETFDKPSLNLKACVGIANQTPPFNISKLWLPKIFVQKTTIEGIAIGKHLLLFLPGEPFSSIGEDLREYGKQRGFQTVTIFGLANSYLGYMMSPKDYETGGYEACNSFYGPYFGTKVLELGHKLLDQISK